MLEMLLVAYLQLYLLEPLLLAVDLWLKERELRVLQLLDLVPKVVG